MKLKMNCGISSAEQNIAEELEKINLAFDYGVDYLSHISIYEPKIKELWNKISKIDRRKTVLCGVPLYESVLFGEPVYDVIKRYVEEYGVGIITLHMTEMSTIQKAINSGFIINSRGGAFLAELLHDKKNFNPNTIEFDKIIQYCQEHNIKIHIGTCMRPGSVSTSPEINQLILEDLKTARCYYDKLVNCGINAEIECMGHVSINQFDSYKYYLGNRKICAMGPLITDSVNGFDDINAMFGYHLAMDKGLNVTTVCMITRSEHIKIPDIDDDRDAIRKWQTYCYLYDLSHNTNNSQFALHRELECISKRSRQYEQCSAHVNIFGEMDIPKHCNICGEHCPLEMKKKGLIK